MRYEEIPAETIDELRSLHRQSSRVRGGTPVGHPDRIAGDELVAAVLAVMDSHGVSISRLSKLMGLSVHTLKLFMMRRGALEATPGVARNSASKPYKNVEIRGRTGKSDTCKWGHDTSTPDKRTGDGHCKECRKKNTNP